MLGRLIETYGVSGHEAPVRDAVIHLLPAWASPTIDSAGNVLVRAGAGEPLVVFVAHMDEIGFTVTAIENDGRLDLRPAGGFYPSLFEAEPALVHTARGVVPAVFAPRDSVGPAPRRSPGALKVDPGTGSRAATEALGIAVGDAVTMPKRFVPLAGTRATGRSMDDRVGCAAELLALRRLDPRLLRHAVLFIFSVREEVGLDGARYEAARLAPEHPARVHAIDTFVSSDAPLEIKTFADAPLGGGAVRPRRGPERGHAAGPRGLAARAGPRAAHPPRLGRDQRRQRRLDVHALRRPRRRHGLAPALRPLAGRGG